MEKIKKYLKNIAPRKYQEDIYSTCKEKNCLVVLPTGLGKTLIALMLSIHFLSLFPEKKVLFLAPTRPLAEQHLNYFEKNLPELFGTLELFTGKTPASKRRKLWDKADIIFSTPQCISNDLGNNLYLLNDTSLLIQDECHRCLKNYSYTFIAKKFKQQSKDSRIAGLTASPGHEKQKLNQICNHLDIQAIEVRTRESEDVKKYIQKRKFQTIKIDFPAEFQEIKQLLKKILDKKVEELKNRKLLFTRATKKSLLDCQQKIMRSIASGNKHFNLLAGASATATSIKLQHALELLETQTLYSLQLYFNQIFDQAKQGKSKAVQKLIKQKEFNLAYTKTIELISKKIEHPKLKKLSEIIENSFSKKPNSKIIVFAQFRDTVTRICKQLNSLPEVNARVFVGQAKKISGKGKDKQETGLNQKQQQEVISDFSLGKINVLVSTSIGEEGLDIPEVSSVIFYEPIPSAIRQIQRCLPEKTKILMSSGEHKEIQNLRKGEKVISYNKISKKLEKKPIGKIFKSKNEKIIKITTNKNNQIKAGKNHPFLTLKGWKYAKNLTSSDYLAICKNIKIKTKYNSILDFLPEKTYFCASKKLKEKLKNRGIRNIDIHNKLKGKEFKINKKTLWGYLNRDAIPIKIFKQILKISKIKIHDFSNIPIKSRKGKKINFSKIHLSEFMWLAGIIASDGDLRKTSKIRENRKQPYFTYRFRIHNSNPKILKKSENILKKIGLHIRKEKENVISGHNTIIGKILNNLGLPLGKKSKTLCLSPILFQSNNEVIKSFLAGVFDGDGNYNKGPCQIRIGTGSQKFAQQLQNLLLRINILSKICKFNKTGTRTIKGKKVNFTGDFYSVEIYKKKHVLKFLKINEIVKISKININIKFSLDSKIEKNIFWVKIKSIKKLPKQKTFNLSIQNNNTFIANNLIVHNSGRTARLQKGELIILITKGTRDESYYWAAFQKQKKMYSSLKSIKKDLDNNKNNKDKQKTL